jgi:hypothetical protein
MNRLIVRCGALILSGSAVAAGVIASQARAAGTADAWPSQAPAHPAVSAQLTGPGLFGAIAATSSQNAWVFGPTGRYALLRGTRWSTGSLPRPGARRLLVTSAVAFNPGTAWAFGVRFIGPESHLRFAPYAARLLRGTWRAVRVPGSGFIVVSAVSASDMWALTGAVPPATGLPSRPRVLHWDGVAWRAEAQPTLTGHATLSGILARSATDVWVGGSVPNGKTGTSELAEHWDGTSWTTASPPAAPAASDYYLTNLVPDGSGGFWAIGQRFSGSIRLWHFTAGAWSEPLTISARWVQPKLARWVQPVLDWVPGTRSIWGINPDSLLYKGLILLYGPVPR